MHTYFQPMHTYFFFTSFIDRMLQGEQFPRFLQLINGVSMCNLEFKYLLAKTYSVEMVSLNCMQSVLFLMEHPNHWLNESR